MGWINRRMVSRIGLYSVAGIVAYSIYAYSSVPFETDEEYCERTGRVKIHGRFFKYDVYENGEMKTISDMLSRECNGEASCEIDQAYKYVLSIPYQESTARSSSRTPSEVINQNGGDCDEKSYLLATLLLQQGHRCVFVTTRDHGFIAVHVEDDHLLKRPLSYLTIDAKRYYFAETTWTNGTIGQYNNVDAPDVDAVFDMVAKKEVPLSQVEWSISKI